MFSSKVPQLEQAVAVNPDVAPDELVRVRAGLWVLRVARSLTFLGVGMGTAFALSEAFLPQGILGIATVFAASMALGVVASHPFHLLQRRRLERALKEARDLRDLEFSAVAADASPIAIRGSGVSAAAVSGPFDALEHSLEQERAERVQDDAEVARSKGES